MTPKTARAHLARHAARAPRCSALPTERHAAMLGIMCVLPAGLCPRASAHASAGDLVQMPAEWGWPRVRDDPPL